MRVQSLWADIQGIPDPVFNLQGDSSQRFVRPIQHQRRILETGAGLARSQRDSRPTQRISSSIKGQEKEARWG